MNVPTGTVTFLFTDIEGSTRLWEEHPDAMRIALARHDALMRDSIERHGGLVFKTVGDAFCAAFQNASDALKAALASQQALASEAWPTPVAIRVRMALHTGTTEMRDNDYFGQPLNRVARLLSVGHGGQTLLSLTTRELTRDAVPPGATLLDLGKHSLRDLVRPENVFQLLHPTLTADFPTLKSLNNPDLRNNLPLQLTSFIGREKEISEIKGLLNNSRLLTLTGGGGSGKTRLSLQVAADELEQYPDGVWFIELASLSDPALVPHTVASVLNIKEEAGRPLIQTLMEALKSRQLLLVLDNCEHLLGACARLTDALLRACPDIKLLASSREMLGIAGEQTYRIPSLSLPDLKQPATIESVSRYEAVQLCIERSRLVKPDFVVTERNASALVAVCRQLDGIPLAIELAAARVRSLSIEDISSKLDSRFRLLTGGSRTALPRQQTLRALIDWSYDLLNPQERALLNRLSVFSGGWTLPAAEAVCAGDDVGEWEMLDLLTSLVDKSLAVAEPQDVGEQTRYRLLETVRQYARDRLEENGESETLRGRHQSYFAALAEEAEPQLIGPEQVVWLRRLEREHDNLRIALEWGNKGASLRMAGALLRFWQTRGYFTEGLEAMMSVLTGVDPQAYIPERAKILRGAGALTYFQGKIPAAQKLYEAALALYQKLDDKQGIAYTLLGVAGAEHNQGNNAESRRIYEESLALLREIGDKRGIAYLLNNLADMTFSQGDNRAARSLHEEGLALLRELGDRQGIARSLNNLGAVAFSQGDYTAARRLHEESLILLRELGDKRGIAFSLVGLALISQNQGDHSEARRLHEEGLALQRELGNKQSIAYSLLGLADVASSQCDYEEARALYQECIAVLHETGDKRGLAYSLMGLGGVEFSQEDYAAARQRHGESLALLRDLGDKQGITTSLEAFAALAAIHEPSRRAPLLWGAAEALREAISAPLPPIDRPRYDLQVTQARAALSEEDFNAAWSEGRAMPLEQAIGLALEEASS